jgi:hypothetical protein
MYFALCVFRGGSGREGGGGGGGGGGGDGGGGEGRVSYLVVNLAFSLY